MIKKYLIISTEQLENALINASLNKSFTTVKYNLDYSKIILKFSGEVPNIFKTLKHYSHSDILIELKKSEWQVIDDNLNPLYNQADRDNYINYTTSVENNLTPNISDVIQLKEQDPDTGGVQFTPRYAPEGWKQQIFELEFETSIGNIHEKDYLDNDIGWSTCKFYKDDGQGGEIECVDQADRDINCTRTDLEWMPDMDYMIKGGWVAQMSTPSVEIYVWAQAAVLPDIYGGPQATFAEGGINLRYMDSKQRNGLDGVAGTILYYNHPQLGPGVGTNKIRYVVRHPAGHRHRLQCIFDLFRQ